MKLLFQMIGSTTCVAKALKEKTKTLFVGLSNTHAENHD